MHGHTTGIAKVMGARVNKGERLWYNWTSDNHDPFKASRGAPKSLNPKTPKTLQSRAAVEIIVMLELSWITTWLFFLTAYVHAPSLDVAQQDVP